MGVQYSTSIQVNTASGKNKTKCQLTISAIRGTLTEGYELGNTNGCTTLSTGSTNKATVSSAFTIGRTGGSFGKGSSQRIPLLTAWTINRSVELEIKYLRLSSPAVLRSNHILYYKQAEYQ